MMEGSRELNKPAQATIARLDPAGLERLMRVEKAFLVPAVGEAPQITLDDVRLPLAFLCHASASSAVASVASISASLCAAVTNISSICDGGNKMPRSSMAL